MGQAMEVGVTGQMTKEFKEQFITLAKTTTVVAVALDPVLLPQQ